MPTDIQYHDKIKNFTWQDLKDLWNEITRQSTPSWEAGKALEYLVLKSFELDGATVKWPYSVPMPNSNEIMEQIDGVVYFDNFPFMIECKDYNDIKNGIKKSINVEPIAKLRNQLLRRPSITVGCIISTGGFTDPARTLVNYISSQTILLWEGTEIEDCINKRSIKKQLFEKYRYCIEYGIHDLNITI